jgi:hypothetical protein
MTEERPLREPISGAPLDLGWIVVAAVAGFILLGLLGLVLFGAIAFFITSTAAGE